MTLPDTLGELSEDELFEIIDSAINDGNISISVNVDKGGQDIEKELESEIQPLYRLLKEKAGDLPIENGRVEFGSDMRPLELVEDESVNITVSQHGPYSSGGTLDYNAFIEGTLVIEEDEYLIAAPETEASFLVLAEVSDWHDDTSKAR